MGDSASEHDGSGSDDDDEVGEAKLEQAEDTYVQKHTAQTDPAEFSDPEYGYNSEDSENEVRISLWSPFVCRIRLRRNVMYGN